MRPFAAVVALCFVTAGCGGGGQSAGPPLSKRQYEKRMQAVLKPMNRRLGALGRRMLRSPTPQAAAVPITAAQATLRRGADQLEDIAPPERVSADHADLIDGLDGLADELEAGRQAAADGDLTGLRQFQDALDYSSAARELRRAADEIEDAGFDIGAS